MIDPKPRSSGAARPARRLLLALVLPLLFGGCAVFGPATTPPGGRAQAGRGTPRGTHAAFKAMVAGDRWAAEWSLLSPQFKRRLNQIAGRSMGPEAYAEARRTVATKAQGDLKRLLDSAYAGEEMLGPNAAIATLEANGDRWSARFVRLTRWELDVVDDPTPQGAFVIGPEDAPLRAEDGSLTVGDRTYAREEIGAYRIRTQWYLDALGDLERQLAAPPGAGGGSGTP